MAKVRRHRIIHGVVGLVAISTMAMPMFSLETENGASYEFGVRAIWESLGSGFDEIASLTAPLVDVGGSADMAGWILVAVYLLAGPLMLAYFGVRHFVAAVGGVFHGNAAISVVLYAAAGWFGLSAWGARTGVNLELLSVADTGFWVGSLALIAGAVVRRIVHD